MDSPLAARFSRPEMGFLRLHGGLCLAADAQFAVPVRHRDAQLRLNETQVLIKGSKYTDHILQAVHRHHNFCHETRFVSFCISGPQRARSRLFRYLFRCLRLLLVLAAFLLTEGAFYGDLLPALRQERHRQPIFNAAGCELIISDFAGFSDLRLGSWRNSCSSSCACKSATSRTRTTVS